MSALIQLVVEQLSVVPPWLATVILATLPIGELRGSLPVALVVYKLPVPVAVFWSILGNLLPVYFLLLFFEHGSSWLRQRSQLAEKFLNYLFARTRRKLEKQVERYGVWALILFVAIPLPVTGAWTGSLAAFVFGLPKQKSFWAITIGVCISATIVTFLTLGTSFGIQAIFRKG